MVSESRTKCSTHSLTLIPGAAALSADFVNAVKRLTPFNASSKSFEPGCFERRDPALWALCPAAQREYLTFFRDAYPPVVTTSCEIGGVMSQFAFTSKNYLKNHTLDQTEKQASITFIVSLSTDTKKIHTTDASYELDTNTQSLTVSGGSFESDDQYVAWAQSVQSFQNPACLNYEAIDLSALLSPPWTTDAELNALAPSMGAAITAYYNRRGCTESCAANFKKDALVDDGTCVVNYPWQQMQDLTNNLALQHPKTWNRNWWEILSNCTAQIAPVVNNNNFPNMTISLLQCLADVEPKCRYNPECLRDNQVIWKSVRAKASMLLGYQGQVFSPFDRFYLMVELLDSSVVASNAPKDNVLMWADIQNATGIIVGSELPACG